MMFANMQNVGDFKENEKSSMAAKSQFSNSRKGLKSRSLNNFTDNSVKNISKKNASDTNSACCKYAPKEKENFKPKIKEVYETKPVPHEDNDNWSDIEEMHIYPEPDDDYEDIIPKCERIQKADIAALFMPICLTKFSETSDQLPSATLEFESIDFPEFYSPVPEIKAALFDDTSLDIVPLPNDLYVE